MGNASFNQDWYGMQAKVLVQSDDRVVVDYGCKGRGIVKNYNLFEGIQLCFLDFESDESMETQKFNPDIIQITHCQTGRYECEFANHTVSYLPEGYFSVAATEHLPVSFSFPLGKYYGVSLVINRQALSDGTRRMMQTIPIDLDKIGTTLGLETRWYVSDTPAQLKHLFSEVYSAAETEPIGYFKIKAIELLYHMDQLTQINGCDLKYFDKKQIQSTKAIREYLVSHLDEKVSLEQMAKEAHLNLSVFHLVFSHIYGDTPYAYLKKYKMNLAAQWLSEDKMKIGDIALELGYQVMLDRYQQTIRELHIEKLKDRNLFDLSGGQKQTIAFASVYALNPDIFVLDEPSSNLDPEAIQELRRLLLLIKSQGKTIVVSEHRLYFLNGIADRIVLMEHGKLKQSWSARDFALLSTEQIKALGLRSYTPARLELPETMPSRNDTPAVEVKDLAIQRALWAGVRRLISSNFLHLLLHHIVDDADFRNFQRRADLHGVDVPIVDQLVGQLAADTQHLPKLFDGHDVQVFRKHHLIKLSELSFLHRLEPPLSVLNPHFCGGFCLLPLIRIVPAPESHHGVSLL